MTARRPHLDAGGDDAGYVTPSFVGTVALTLLLLIVLANVLVFRYADGVLQAAVESGARQGLSTGSVETCETHVAGAVASGLGAMGAGVDNPVCVIGADIAQAEITATFTGWLPFIGDHTSVVRSTTRGVGGSR